MTLRAKFLDINEIRNYNHFNLLTDKLEKVADDFAMEFKDWCDNEGRFTIGVNTTQELLRIYKKEKGL
jgi:hypothetical protein